MSGPTTTVFIRDDAFANFGSGGDPFLKVERPGSITLQTLTDEFGVTSLVECDARGVQQPRALVLDRPEEVLHQNTFYVTRKRARAPREVDGAPETSYGLPHSNHANANKTVHFKKSVAVQEFLLPSSDSCVSRPSVDLLGGNESASTKPTVESLQTTNSASASPTLPPSQQSAEVKLAFSSFCHVDVNTGKKMVITLDLFRDMIDRSRATLAASDERHASFLKSIAEADAVGAALDNVLQRAV